MVICTHFIAYNKIIFFESMQFLMGTFSPPLCLFFIPPTSAFLPPTNMPQPAPEIAQPENAEIIPQQTAEERITVSREDLLKEGYEKTKRAWTEEEDKLLMHLCKDENARFDEIAEQILGRNSKMCYSRYRRLKQQSKNSWSRAEDKLLAELVDSLGQSRWQ